MPDESGGGILADEMGMGKSLTMLVLIRKTMRDARQWAEEEKALPDAALSERPCRATLVIVPSRGRTTGLLLFHYADIDSADYHLDERD